LTKCLVDYSLCELSTLRDFNLADQIKEIRNNLVVVQNANEPNGSGNDCFDL